MSEQNERLWCTACGTVTRDMTCDCNQYGQPPRAPNFVNYADAMQETAHKQALQIDELKASLAEMVGIYWGDGDGIDPPPACIQRALAVLASIEVQS